MTSFTPSLSHPFRFSTLILTLLSLFLLVACSQQADTPQGEGGAKETEKRRFLSIGTAPPGGAFFVVGGAIAQTVGDAEGNKNWDVSAEATKGTMENIRRLEKGELDLALANAAITYFAVRGEEGWDKAYDMQSVITLAPNIALFITAKSSGVKNIADLKGKRVVVGPAGAGFEYFIRPILAAHGVSYEDFTPLNATQTAAVDMLSDGSADAAFLGGAVPTASITQAATSQDIHFIPFADAAREKLINDYPFFSAATIPPGTYKGLDTAYEGLNVGSMILIASAKADTDLIYQFTKSAYENRAEIVKRHPAGKAINPKNAPRSTGLSFHPGAVKFYKEAGIWPEPAGTP
ncbi:TAXI family TRAP transporter solute-binding subunit [Acanthopleuribacter pedis]|uniref:TAXI family TRAP transporter solute-binding subunit n=1 Tax=Acanthopleuribacter pedis TaxID=442870 RepID=A0A8J7U588_9BACT|nr:TAXI family TRAP transporter solute-binding subunit [Acanthopleuribacter pedis]MBO1320218.1 TAXI family TRAP transporter solute-binding subunit [Acanthopleuribacter pedis]